MKYLLIRDDVVHEIIPGEDPTFPGVPIQDRFAPNFIAGLEAVPDDTVVEELYVKIETGFAPPPIEPGFPVDPPAPDPTWAERVEALEAAMLATMMGGL